MAVRAAIKGRYLCPFTTNQSWDVGELEGTGRAIWECVRTHIYTHTHTHTHTQTYQTKSYLYILQLTLTKYTHPHHFFLCFRKPRGWWFHRPPLPLSSTVERSCTARNQTYWAAILARFKEGGLHVFLNRNQMRWSKSSRIDASTRQQFTLGQRTFRVTESKADISEPPSNLFVFFF